MAQDGQPTVRVISPEGQSGVIPYENLGTALKKGYSLPGEPEQVSVINPDGQRGVIPYENLTKAIDQGFQYVPEQQKQRTNQAQDKDGPSAAQVGAGLVTEIGIGAGGQALGTALAPFTFGTSYPVLSFGSGIVGSAAAQNIEGQDKFSWGRAFADGLINLIPGGKIGKTGIKTGKELTKQVIKSGAIKSTAGAGIGGAYEVIQTGVDEKRLPEAEEFLTSSLTGAVLGGGFGVGGTLASNKVKKWMRDPFKLDDAIQKGDTDALNLADAIYEKTEIEPYKSPNVFLKTISSYAGAPSKSVGPEVTKEIRQAKNLVSSRESFASKIQNQIRADVKQYENPQEAAQLLNRYVTGEITDLPDQLSASKAWADVARQDIYELQGKLLDNHYSGANPLPKALADKIEASRNNGDYLTRTYKWFSDPSYEPSAQAKNKLIVGLKRSGMEKKEIDKFFSDLDAKKATPEGFQDVSSLFIRKHSDILKTRNNLSSEFREYLGEITSAPDNMGATITNLARLTAYDKADFAIKNTLVRSGLASTRREKGLVPLTLKRGIAKEGDNQLFVPEYTQKAINNLYVKEADQIVQDGVLGTLLSTYRNAIGISKLVKVPFNPPSWAVQFYGNLINLTGMAMNPFRGINKAKQYSFFDFSSSMPNAMSFTNRKTAKKLGATGLNEFKRLQELGLIDANVVSQDIRQAFKKDAVGALTSKIADPVGKGYAGPDTMFRLVAYENHKNFLSKAFPNAKGSALEEVAAELTNNTYQNSNMLSNTIRQLSRYGVLAQFAAFWFELMRNQYNQGRLIKRMLSGQFANDYAGQLGKANMRTIKAEGAKRLVALTALYGSAIGGVSMFNRQVGGVSEEEERAWRETGAPIWDEENSLAIVRKGDKVYYKNMSYLIPHLDGAKVALSALRGDNFTDSMGGVTRALMESFGGEGDFILSNLFPALQDFDPDKQREISGAGTPMGELRDRSKWFVSEAFTPGVIREMERAMSRDQGWAQTAIRQLGIRVNNTTIQDGAGFRIRKVKNNISAIKRNLASARYEFENNPERLKQAHAKLNQQYHNNLATLKKHADNLRVWGLSENEIIKIMKDSGVSGKDILFALDGKNPDLPIIKRQTPSDTYSDIIADVQPEKRVAAIKQIEDPDMRSKVLALHKRVKRMERAGINEREQIVKSLGVSDGEMAQYIYDMMQQSENPEGYLRMMVRKGIATDRVRQQVRLLQGASQ